MSEMHHHLRRHHHLRHYGRIQYGLFIKGIGVRITDALTFFRNEFSKLGDKKLNEYQYQVEHNYGLKGKKLDYTPWACQKLINSYPPGNGDCHGCPYAYYSEGALREALKRKIIKEGQIENIIDEWKSSGAISKLLH